MSQEHRQTTTGTASEQPPPGDLARRGLLLGVGVAGVAGLAAACGKSGSSDSYGASSSGSGSASSSGSSPGGGGTSGAGGAGGGGLARTADIPVGGGKIFPDAKVVVTQPSQGEFKAFSAVCTHMGCTVGSVSGGLIHCPCHGSEYHIADGTVARPPAPSRLAPKKITVSGGEINLA
ncbi:Rieske (2Fe-2S) protein [Actinomadura gamaensis]|uniref:Cytochrome bc1 complex Rieske iron-sulfur subunit n=1 Tax=Actinomadura gamaensis TaxID=1763541 RepID=A0ABV9TYH0_9ACTN